MIRTIMALIFYSMARISFNLISMSSMLVVHYICQIIIRAFSGVVHIRKA